MVGQFQQLGLSYLHYLMKLQLVETYSLGVLDLDQAMQLVGLEQTGWKI
jgi:hypothetical protein